MVNNASSLDFYFYFGEVSVPMALEEYIWNGGGIQGTYIKSTPKNENISTKTSEFTKRKLYISGIYNSTSPINKFLIQS